MSSSGSDSDVALATASAGAVLDEVQGGGGAAAAAADEALVAFKVTKEQVLAAMRYATRTYYQNFPEPRGSCWSCCCWRLENPLEMTLYTDSKGREIEFNLNYGELTVWKSLLLIELIDKIYISVSGGAKAHCEAFWQAITAKYKCSKATLLNLLKITALFRNTGMTRGLSGFESRSAGNLRDYLDTSDFLQVDVRLRQLLSGIIEYLDSRDNFKQRIEALQIVEDMPVVGAGIDLSDLTDTLRQYVFLAFEIEGVGRVDEWQCSEEWLLKSDSGSGMLRGEIIRAAREYRDTILATKGFIASGKKAQIRNIHGVLDAGVASAARGPKVDTIVGIYIEMCDEMGIDRSEYLKTTERTPLTGAG